MDKLQPKYDFKTIESQIIDYWLKNKLASFKFSDKKAQDFTIVIPPPNVTGHLHLGHAWDGIIQDCVIRYKRLNHFNSIWIPGTDHAGIATQVKFENYLKQQNIQKSDLSRKQFIALLNEWKDNQSHFIHDQWNKMGFLLDYSQEKFTLDAVFSQAVLTAFVNLYKAGLIYEGYKLVNWDYQLKTAISDIEVIHKDTQSKFYFINYDVVDKNNQKIDTLLIATTRPETMFGDVCVVINPKDERYTKYLNKKVINPANNELLPIITDEYVDISFGTGVMKCTPAHDFNDYELGLKHYLKMINILHDDGTLNANCPLAYQNLSIEQARSKLVDALKQSNHLHHIEEINNRVGYSERTNVVVQPYLTKQWFLKTSVIAKEVIKLQNSNKKVEFLPSRFENTLLQWLNNMQDWCISRQLWWGHQLPIWYHKQTNEVYCDLIPPKDIENWTRSSDVLDTWFSSGLWPMIACGWTGKQDDLKHFPTSLLVTGYDIIFFWIARMMMFSAQFMQQVPFEKVYIHGLVKDELNRKMSKSLGNGIEPQTIIDEYGNDALRIFFLSDCSAGEDISYKPAKLRANFNFLMKLYNAAKFIEINELVYNPNFEIDWNKNNGIETWILYKLNAVSDLVKKQLDKYNFNVAFKHLSDFVWNDFCNFYLECLKQSSFKNHYSIALSMKIWKNVLIMLQSFIPFLTEYLYQHQIDANNSLLKQTWWKHLDEQVFNLDLVKNIDLAILLLSKIRQVRSEHNIANNVHLTFSWITTQEVQLEVFNEVLKQNNASLVLSDISVLQAYEKIVIAINDQKFETKIPNFDLTLYKNKLLDKISKLHDEVKRSTNILSNDNFIKKASAQKIQLEREKFTKYQSELSQLENELHLIENK